MSHMLHIHVIRPFYITMPFSFLNSILGIMLQSETNSDTLEQVGGINNKRELSVAH